MITKHKTFALIVSLLVTTALLSLFSSSAMAQGMGCRMNGYDRQWSNSNVPAKYQLTPEQSTKVREILSKYDDEIFPLQKELRALRIEASGYASRSDAEIGKIKSYRKDIHNLDDKIADLRMEARTGISKVLNKEQRAYFDDNFGWGYMDGSMMNNMGRNMDMHCPMMSESIYR